MSTMYEFTLLIALCLFTLLAGHNLCLFVISVISHFGFESTFLVLVLQAPGHCLSFASNMTRPQYR